MTALEKFIFTFFHWETALAAFPDVLKGAVVTVVLGLLTAVAGIAAGLCLAVLRALQIRALSLLIIVSVDMLRAVPPLVLIILFYFAFPLVGLSMPAAVAVWLALSMVLAAYAEETVWSGLLALPPGQSEAARSTGLTWLQAMAYVLLPQALRIVLPTLTNRVIVIMKNTALGSVVALGETLNVAQSASSHAGNPTPLTLAAVLYLLIFLPIIALARRLEARQARA